MVPTIKCTCTVFIYNFRNINFKQLIDIGIKFVREVMIDMWRIQEIIQRATLGIPKGMKKNAISISIAFSINILIRNENITSEQHKTKKPLK